MDTSAFPERLEPFRVRPAPLTGADFTIPQWGGKVRSTEGGMYLLSQAAVERHGVRIHSNVSRFSSSIFPLVGQLSTIQAVTVPEADKVQLCIPPAAKWFAWSYPCSDHVNLAPVDETDASAMCAACSPCTPVHTLAHTSHTRTLHPHPSAHPLHPSPPPLPSAPHSDATLFLNTGGFVYFDEAREIGAPYLLPPYLLPPYLLPPYPLPPSPLPPSPCYPLLPLATSPLLSPLLLLS